MEDKFFKQLPFIAFIMILSVILAFSLYENIRRGAEEKLEARYQEGIEVGREEVFSEIKKDLDTIKGYRFPIKKEDGTDGFRILIEVPSQ
jgi:hypothetical protein